MAAASLALGLLLLEAAARAGYAKLRNLDTEMWRYATLGKTVLPGAHPVHGNKPGAYFEDLYGVEVRINSKGLRDAEHAYEKPAGRFRILVLGDSITFGWGVPADRSYPKVLETALNAGGKGRRFEVLNAGVGNYGAAEELAFLEAEGWKYRPDLVILGYYVNDAELVSYPSSSFWARRSTLLPLLWSRVNSIRARLDKKRRYKEFYSSLYADGSETKARFESAFTGILRSCGRRGVPLLVALIPDLRDLRSQPFAAVYDRVRGLAEGFPGARALDLAPAFVPDPDASKFWVSPEDAHPNALAHRLLADRIHRLLASGFDFGRKRFRLP